MEKEDLFGHIIWADNDHLYYYDFHDAVYSVEKTNTKKIAEIEEIIKKETKGFVSFMNPNQTFEKIDLYSEKLSLIEQYKDIKCDPDDLMKNIYLTILLKKDYYASLCEKFNLPEEFDESIIIGYLSFAYNLKQTNEKIIHYKNHMCGSKKIIESQISFEDLKSIINDLYMGEYYLACVILSLEYNEAFEFEFIQDEEVSMNIQDSFDRINSDNV